MKIDPDKFFAELEQVGEDQVRKNLASEAVYGAYKKSLVQEWIRRKDAARADALAASGSEHNSEQIRISRSAKNAAWVAAAAALVAAIFAAAAFFSRA